MKIFGVILNNLLVIEMAQAVMLVFILLLMKRNHWANIFLSIYMLIVSFPFILFFLAKAHFDSAAHVCFSIFVGLCVVSGSFVYWYVSAISGLKKKILRSDYRILLLCPLFAIVGYLIIPPHGPNPAESTFHRITAFLFFLVMHAIPTFYVFKSFILIRRYYKAAEGWYSDADKISMAWLKKITVLSLSQFIVMDFNFLLSTLLGREPRLWFFLFFLILAFSIIYITAYHVMRQDEIFRDSQEMNELYEVSEPSSPKYAKQSISDDDLKRYSDILIRHMDEQKPYLDEEITIRSLAEQLDIPIHHLSIVINSVFNKNFTTFINEFRINEAKAMLEQSQEAEVNILAIAYRSGFSSKSSFNMTFKKLTGLTPSQFRQSIA